MKKIMILAGEASGDLHGALLASALKRLETDVSLWGVGGPRMKEAGVKLIHESSSEGIIGPWNALGKIPFLVKILFDLRRNIEEERPDILILIDTPSMNMRLSRFAKEKGIKTAYFFPPSAWFPSLRRASKIASISDSVIPVFRFSAETFTRAGEKCDYFGHPILDAIDVSHSREEILQEMALERDREYVGLLPGSRQQEIRSLLPVMVKAGELLLKKRPWLFFLLPVAAPGLTSIVEQSLRICRLPLRILNGRAHEVMKVSRLVIMASGTASLEAAIIGTPMIVLYKLAWPDWCIGKLIIRVPFIALPNLILQRPVVPELLQTEANPRRTFQVACDLLEDGKMRSRTIEALGEVKASLGEPGVIDRVAERILNLLEE